VFERYELTNPAGSTFCRGTIILATIHAITASSRIRLIAVTTKVAEPIVIIIIPTPKSSRIFPVTTAIYLLIALIFILGS